MLKHKRLLRCLSLLFGCCLSWFIQTELKAADTVAENDLKAAYLIHLSEFTSWPDEKMQPANFFICLAAESSLKNSLEQVRGQLVKEKKLDIIYDVPAENLKMCHIFYVETQFNDKIFQQIVAKNESILTVSSESNFVKENGIIEYYKDNDKIKMRVNLKMMNQAKLMISSKLLRLMDSNF